MIGIVWNDIWNILHMHSSKVKDSIVCHYEPDWWFWYENCFQCLGIESTSIASDSDIGTLILALKNH